MKMQTVEQQKKAEYMRAYYQRPEAKAKRAEYNRRRRACPEYRERMKEWRQTYNSSGKGAAAQKRYWSNPEKVEARNRYYSSPIGRATKNACETRRRAGIETANYWLLRRDIETLRCVYCGEQAEQVDHVLPIALARICGLLHVVDEYVEPACRRCHRKKSRMDRGAIASARRQLQAKIEEA